MSKQKHKIAARISMVNAIYGVSMPVEAIEYQAHILSEYDFDLLMSAFDKYMRETKFSKPPTPGQIIEILSPKVSDRSVAIDLARKIDRAIAKHGWNWEQGYWHEDGQYWTIGSRVVRSFKEAFIDELGAVAWHAVCCRGGWLNVRNSAAEMEEGQFIAQLRDQIESSMTLAARGVDVTKIEMPKPRTSIDGPVTTLRICDMPDDNFTKKEEQLISLANGNRNEF